MRINCSSSFLRDGNVYSNSLTERADSHPTLLYTDREFVPNFFPFQFVLKMMNLVGMGKTIMVSSLIQTNRGEKPEEEIPLLEDLMLILAQVWERHDFIFT